MDNIAKSNPQGSVGRAEYAVPNLLRHKAYEADLKRPYPQNADFSPRVGSLTAIFSDF